MASRQEMEEVQRRIAARAKWEDDFGSLRRVGGVDQAHLGDRILSAAVALEAPAGKVVEVSTAARPATLPYIPGFLAFREMESALAALRGLERLPDLLFVDGAGVNHPRFAGLATHLGVELDLPTVGVTKSVLCGTCERPPKEPGQSAPLVFGGRHVGVLLQTRAGSRPIVVAPGHRVSVSTAEALARRWLRGRRLPEPIRRADEEVRRHRKNLLGRGPTDFVGAGKV